LLKNLTNYSKALCAANCNSTTKTSNAPVNATMTAATQFWVAMALVGEATQRVAALTALVAIIDNIGFLVYLFCSKESRCRSERGESDH